MKKIILPAVLSFFLSAHAFALNTYSGISLGWQSISATTSTFHAWRPGLFIGYGGMMGEDDQDDYYLAGELAITWPYTIKNDYINRNDSLRLSPMITLSIIPGIIITPPVLGYLRLGIGEGNMRARGDWLRDYITGVGFEYGLTPCWSLRGEVDYNWFRTINVGTPRGWDGVLSLKYTWDA